MERRSVPCTEDGAETFAAGSVVVLIRKVGDARGKAKYEVKIKRAEDCSVVDLIPETASLTSREVARLLKKAGLTPAEIEKYVEWARKLMSGPSREEVASLFREVVKAAEEALSGRLDSPHLDLLIPKRDKETLTDCRPSECWKSANAAAVIPTKIDERLGILDFDSEEALQEAGELGFDPKKYMHILAGPLVDAVLTPEGEWRTPDGRVLDSIPRKLHVPVYIPEGCRRDISSPGFELKCTGEINVAGRHPSGAEYKFVDGELLAVSFKQLKEFAETFDGYGHGEVTLPECNIPRRVDVDRLTELFSRIYSAAQAAGYSRHDALYDLGILCRFACVPKEDAEEIAKRVYGTAGGESQTLSQRLSHIERAYRSSRDGGPKLRPPNKIYERWRQIDEAAAEEIFKLLDVEVDRVLAKECIGETEIDIDKDDDEDGKIVFCNRFITAMIRKGQLVIAEEHTIYNFRSDKSGDVRVSSASDRKIIYRGPRPKRVYDVARKIWYYEVGGFYGTSIEQLFEKLSQPGAGLRLHINTRRKDEILTMLRAATKTEEVALTVGFLPRKNGVALVDIYGILDVGPSLEEAVADLDKALRSVIEAHPEVNRDAVLATVGYVLGLNAAPVWWYHKPNAEVPLPIIYGASQLGKSVLMTRVVEPAVVGLGMELRAEEISKKLVDESLIDIFIPEIHKTNEYTTPEQLRNDLDINTLVLILDEQKPGDPRSPKASAKIFGKFWLQVATAKWGRRLSQHAARYGGGFGYKFYRMRAFAIVTNYSPDEWKRAGLADAVSAEGAIDRRIFEIPWEDVKFNESKLKIIYTPKYSILKVLEVAINKHFDELTSQEKFPEFVAALWRKVVEDFEPKLGKLDGIRAMVEALERLIQYNRERNKLRDPDVAAKEELRRNALTYLREVAKVLDLSPAKLVAKVVEYAAELGLVFRKPRWPDEIDKVREDFCKALAKAVDVPDYDCGGFVTTMIEAYKTPAEAPLFNLIIDRELREALWRIFVDYAAKGYVPSVLAGSVFWPKNTKMLGRIPRTSLKRSDGAVEHYYRLTWQDFFEVFVGRLVAGDKQTTGEYNTYLSAGISGGEVVSPPIPLTNLENQATNIETAAPANVDTSQEQSGLITSPPPAGDYLVVGESAAIIPRDSAVVSPQVPLTQLEGRREEVEAVSSVGKEQSELITRPHAPTTEVINPHSSLTESRGHVANIEPAPAASISVSQEQRGLTIQPPLTPAQTYNINEKIEISPLAETAESRKLDSAETCLANSICMNRLILCLWKRLKVPKEERKAAIAAEIERRGDLFAYCLKDAVEYARRESEP
ncbi:MAG: hypothetical protein ACO2PM_16950 [Pyrobaculum sp.]|jgi:hypothetical protein